MATIKTIKSWTAVWDKIQTLFGFNSIESPFNVTPRTIDEPLTLYVETTGNDRNPGTQAAPFATVQAAISYLAGFKILAPVIVQVGLGTFPPFCVTDLDVGYNSDQVTGAYVLIQGTFIETVPATAPTSQGTGVGGTTVGVTINDTTKTWTVDQFAPAFIETTASGTPTISKIISNTATSILAIGPIGTVTSYRVLTCGTFILGAVASGNAPPVTGGSPTPGPLLASATAAVAFAQTNPAQTSAPIIQVRRFDIATNVNTTAAYSVHFRGNTWSTLEQCYIHRTVGTTALIEVRGNANAEIRRCGLNVTIAGGNAIATTVGSAYLYISLQTCSIRGVGVTGGTGLLSIVTSSSLCYVSSTCISGFATGISLAGSANAGLILVSSIDSCTTGISTSSDINWSAGWLGNCGTGILATLGARVTNSAVVSGTGNTLAFSATKGGTIQLSSGVTATGTTELSVDGVTSTIAAMRALTPKCFPATPNVYGSYVYE